MVYIYQKRRGNKTYYYLRASARKGDRLQTKDIAYLGDNPSTILEKLKALPHMYAKDIRKSYKTIERFLEINFAENKVKELKPKTDSYLGKELTIRLEACRYHFQKVFLQLDAHTREEAMHTIAIEFAFNTTSLEGNTITLKQAERLLSEQRTPKNKTLREIYDVQNSEQVFKELFENPLEELTHKYIQNIHKKLSKNIDVRIGYRTQEIRVFKSHFDASPTSYVASDMDNLLRWYKRQKSLMHPFVLATIFHHHFEKIHPFMDGNGRTGRMLLNHILYANGFPPVIITKRNRDSYISALGKADKANLESVEVEFYTPLVRFIALECIKNYWNIFL